MPNSFNISVAPEISAVSAKVSANKVVIDENKVIVADIHDTDLPAAKTVIDENKVIVANIHDTDLPSAKTVIDENKVIVADIHDTDLPAAKTVIDENKVVVDAINAKIPQVVRGTIKTAYLSNDTTEFVDLINVLGKGKLLQIAVVALGTHTFQVKLTIDGVEFATYSEDGGYIGPLNLVAYGNNDSCILGEPASTTNLFSRLELEFDTSLRIESRRSAGTGFTHISCKYLLDEF